MSIQHKAVVSVKDTEFTLSILGLSEDEYVVVLTVGSCSVMSGEKDADEALRVYRYYVRALTRFEDFFIRAVEGAMRISRIEILEGCRAKFHPSMNETVGAVEEDIEELITLLPEYLSYDIQLV